MRKITYLTGSRADFGLMRNVLQALRDGPDFELRIIATGMHTFAQYGDTLADVRALGVPTAIAGPGQHDSSGAGMARAIGTMIGGLVDLLQRDRPDLLLLLGDRGEMLAGATAALHLNIAIAHIHGGERSGTVDEPVRHAISKLAHIHLVATAESRDRLVRMGERPETIHVVGAPGLDGLLALADKDRGTLEVEFGLDAGRPLALFLYHPVLLEAAQAGQVASAILDCLHRQGYQILALMPNSDAGADAVRAVLQEAERSRWVTLKTHLARSDFVSAMAQADLMIGNSSSGIIEAATFGTPVVNIGQRQNLRQRNANVVDVTQDRIDIERGLKIARSMGRRPIKNVYGDGQAAGLIYRILGRVALNDALLAKVNSY